MKRSTSRLLSTLLVLCMVLALLPGTALAAEIASGICGENLTWTLDSNRTLTISGTGAMTDYDNFEGVYTPWDDHITAVVIRSGVTTIGDWAFYEHYSLASVTIPDSVVSIGHIAFEACYSLKSVTIPNSVTTIGDSAFRFCTGLTSITIPDSVTTIGDSVFDECWSLISVTIPSSVTSIKAWAFYRCESLTDVYYAGSESQWKQIVIGESNDSLLNATIHYNSIDPDTPNPDITFTDIPKDTNAWYRDLIYNAVSKGLIKGNNDGEFKPENKINRAEFTALILRLLNGGDPEKVEDMSKWYNPHYAYAKDHGLLEGLPEDAEKEDPIPRYEMAQLIYNAAKSKGLDVESDAKDFYESDHSYSESYDVAIRYAYGVGLFSGKDANGDFAGADTLKRSEAAKVIWLFYEMAVQE